MNKLTIFWLVIIVAFQFFLISYVIKERNDLRGLVDMLNRENQRYLDVTKELGIDITKPLLSTTVTISAYSARPEECDATPEVTASGKPSRIGMLAVSRDMRDEIGLKFGQKVWLKGLGQFKVCDLMHSRFKRRVDILHASPEAATLFGTIEGTILWFGEKE